MMDNDATNKFDPIHKIEILLRNIVSEVLSARVGANWLQNEEHGLGMEKVKELEGLMVEEEGRRYTALVDLDLLSYTEFRELKEILEKDKNRDLFKKIFRDWEAFKIYLKKAEYLRNPAKHHRFLYPHEMLLLEGIAGEIEHFINTWHIGGSFDVKRYRFVFFEYVETKGRTKTQILESTKGTGREWIDRVKKYFLGKGTEEPRIRAEKEDFKGSISAGNIKAYWHSTPKTHPTNNINGIDYKSIELKLWYSPSSRFELTDLMKFIDKKYAIFAFELDGRINVDKLMKIAKEIAGLTPSSSQNHESAEYNITNFSRIGIRNIDQKTGEIFIQNDDKFYFKNAHNVISPGTILSYLTGNMPRRLIISLIKSSI